MGMVVRTNYSALNATKNLNKNNAGLSGSLEKLASGFKINKAADDASGLAISEKMKSQIKALDTASANAEDGISMVQTAEGYLTEIHDMLNRMVELSMKSANGTYESVTGSSSSTANSGVVGAAGTDRDALQLEMDQLCAEIDRIANTANFNNVKLFDGSMSTSSYNKLDSATTAAYATNVNSFSNQALTSGYTTTVASSVSKSATSGLRLQIGETSREADKLTVSIKDMSTAALFNAISSYTNGDNSISADATDATKNILTQNLKNTVSGISAFSIDISSQDKASLATEAIRTVINGVSNQRAELGAIQNRLDYTVNNLDTASENITSANSRIRDTDVAKEMTKYTQMNVLSQAAQSMLAQANQLPQQALQLLG